VRKTILALALCTSLGMLAGCAIQNSNQNVSINQTAQGVEIQSSNSILFDTGKYDIKPDAAPFLDQVANLLKNRTQNNVLIDGYTDNVGDREFNQELSKTRALIVMKQLVDRGVQKTRIKAVGYGMSHPIADNSTEAGRQKNRRTNIIILGEKQENLGNDPLGNLLNSIQNLFH
jgi:outer membrane protein OmpA-like peptidoglycan-associated protein